jgi:hypothetical protein
MAYISVSLSPTDPQPGNYSIYISSCVSGSTKTLVKSGLKNPLDFPYSFNSSDFLPDEDCLNYELVDRRSDCKKTGTISLLPPSETPKPTNTPTPTNTPLPSNVFDAVLNLEVSSGSTVIKYSIITSKPVPKDYTVSFINTLYDNLNNEFKYNITVKVSKGTQIGTKTYGIPNPTYSNIRRDRYHIEVTNKSIIESNLDRYNSFKFTDDDDEPQGFTTPWRFQKCCVDSSGPTFINANVPTSETQGPNGWVYLQKVVVLNGECYRPAGPFPFTAQISIPDYDYESCQTSECQDLCETSVNVGLKLLSCCYDNITIPNVTLTLPYFPQEGQSIFLDTQVLGYPIGCYRISTAWQSNDTPELEVDEILPNCDYCNDNFIDCDTKSWKAINCCNPNDIITVLTDDVDPNTTIGQGFIWNGQCWRFIPSTGNWYESVTYISQDQYYSNICSNSLCPDCGTPTPTPTPTTTPKPPYPPEIKEVRMVSCCDSSDIIPNAIAEFLVPPVTGEFIYYTGGFESSGQPVLAGCYEILNLSVPTGPFVQPIGQVTSSYGSVDCTPCFEQNGECIQVFESCNEDCGEVLPYEGQTTIYVYNNITYNVPLTINSVCDLLPLANSNYFVSNYAMAACAQYHFENQTPCSQIPWLCEQVGAVGALSSLDILDAFYLTIPQLSTVCSTLPCVVYGQGLSANVNSVYLSNDFDSCYTYVDNEIPNGQVITVFNLGEEFSGCTHCQPLTPTPTPTLTQTPTPTIPPPEPNVWEVRLIGCCDNLYYVDNILFTNGEPQTNDSFYWIGNSQFPNQCYEILELTLLPLAPSEFLTLDVNLTSGGCSRCEETHPCNIIWRAINCCDELLSLNVTVDLNSPPIIGQGFINPLDNECYQFVQISSAVGEIEVSPADYIDNICESDECPSCPSATPTMTPTMTQTPTMTLTPSPTATPYAIQDNVILETCCKDTCGNISNIYANLYFAGSITSVSVGDFIIIDGVAYQVDTVNAGIPIEGQDIILNDSQIITSPPLGCEDPLVLPYVGDCHNNYLSGCTTGNIYAIFGPSCVMYYEIGETLYSEELFGPYGDYCATVISGEYENPTIVVTFTEIPSVNGCYYSDCDVPPTPTPTNSPTITPTQTINQTPTPTPTPTQILESCEDDGAGGLIHENEGTIIYPSPTPTITPTVSPNYVVPSIKTVFIHVPNS